MSESNRDELADALSRLADGHHQSDRSDQTTSSGAVQWFGEVPTQPPPAEAVTSDDAAPAPEIAETDTPKSQPTSPQGALPVSPPVSPPAPATKRLTPPPPPPMSARRTITPPAPNRAPSPPIVAPSVPASNQLPSRPAAPAMTPVATENPNEQPIPRPPTKARPAAPTKAARASEPAIVAAPIAPSAPEIPSDDDSVITDDDDDNVNVAAPTIDMLAHSPVRPTKKQAPFYASLNFRRTLIPPMLTLGVSLPSLATWIFLLDQDSPLKSAGLMLPLTLLIFGGLMLVLAAVNMLAVKGELAAKTTKTA